MFAALVPGGKGELVMQRRHQAAQGDEEEEEGDGAGPSNAAGGGAIGKYNGVKVRGRALT